MPTPLIHFIVPLFILLVLLKKDRYVLWLSPFALFPDLDFGELHRELLHNIFAAFAVAFLMWMILKRQNKVFYIVLIYIMSHIILDIFSGGVAVFYPIYTKSLYINTAVGFDIHKHLLYVFDYGILPKNGVPRTNLFINIVSGLDSAVIVLISGMYLIRKKI